jgi:urate oxidase/2-oxo-4-hydroxy-4-carboxy-5-ureidoimidazoline decarboxylase
VTTTTPLAQLDRDAFLSRLGFAFEHSPWVTEEAWEHAPFPTLDALLEALRCVVGYAPADRALALLRAHPELAGAPAEGLTPASAGEQASAGLDRLAPTDHARLLRGQQAYRERFGFPYVVCVRDHTVATILADLEGRLDEDRAAELQRGLEQVCRIAELRIRDALTTATPRGEPHPMSAPLRYEISYGKAHVAVYRQYARPLGGIAAVPESPFAGRANALFANEISVEVFGDNFLPSYTEGDNAMVVATDSMKNFILREGRTYDGATLEGYLHHLGDGLLRRYEQIEALRVSGEELPFEPVALGGRVSATVHRRLRGDRASASLLLDRGGEDGAPRVVEQRSGRVEMELLKTRGSAFTRFVRDEYTTLPDRVDRPLYVGLDVEWRYADARDAIATTHDAYVPSEQVRDVCAAVFDGLVSESIQQLVHAMGERLLERFPQLASVAFVGRNLTRDPFAVGEDPDDERKVFCDPFPAAGTIALTMTREGSA